jgi:hypothetical protein
VPRLVVEKGPQKGRSIKVDATCAVTVGRGNAADLQIDDPMTSRRHFSVEHKQGGYYITDLGSANGTYLNGEKITESVLEMGDMIQAGEILLSFLADESTLKHDTVTGQKIAGYLIEERIGRGAMGTVYKATQLSLDRTVALKILARELVSDTGFIDMFVREAQNAGQLNHPNIVQVYDVGNYKSVYYFSMEYMAGGSVYDLINREGAQPFDRALALAADSARGLLYAEKRGIVHRDIKPDNLMLGVDGTAKIGDLGIARRMHAGTTVAEEGIFGSPHYMAPEQAQGLKVDARTDIYSLGATMYHVLSGKTPFSGKSPQEIILKQINEKPRPLLEANPLVPPEVAAVVEKCMAKDPEARYGSSKDLLDELTGLKGRAHKIRGTVPLKERAKELKRKYLLPLIVVVIAAAAAAAGFFIYRGYVAGRREYQVAWQKAQEALKEAQEHLDKKNPDRALEVLKRIRKEHAGLPEVTDRAAQLEKAAKTLAQELAAEVLAREADQALAAARKFEKDNPGNPAEAAQKYQLVARKFSGTDAASAARSEERRLRKEIEEKKGVESLAQAQLQTVMEGVRTFAARHRYGKALELLDTFPERFRDTDAAKEIEAKKTSIMQDARRAFDRLKAAAQQLVAKKQYEQAKGLLLDAAEAYQLKEITEEAERMAGQIDKMVEQLEDQQKKQALDQDRKVYSEGVAKARGLVLEHKFDSAAAEYRSLPLLLSTNEYRDMAKLKLEEIALAKAARQTLIDQINRKQLASPIQIKLKNNKTATAIRADADKLIAKYDDFDATAPYSWAHFSAAEIVSFLGACSLDARGHLAAGVYAKELGEADAARQHFDSAVSKDSAIKGEVEKFSKDLR